MNSDKLISLKPHLEFKIWGGDKIKELKNLTIEERKGPVGEAWEISCHPSGKSLNQENTEIEADAFPYLVKLIDTNDNLSIQVHPGDEYANRVENSKGKSECWLIVAAEEGAGIYLGFREGVTKEKFEFEVNNNGKVDDLLVYYEVTSGDFFYVPAGSIHAIGKGVTLVEIQQSSGITYRVWDWNRLGLDGKPRDLHIEKALDVCNFENKDNSEEIFKIRKRLFGNNKQSCKLIEDKEFQVNLYQDIDNIKLTPGNNNRIDSLYCLHGIINVEVDEMKIELSQFSSCLINCTEDVLVTGQEGSTFIHIS